MGSPLSRASVLVADPDPDACLLYASTLQIHEDQVVQAVDGREALVKVLAARFSLVITETRVPFIDGFSLCEILRRDRATQSVPILVVTADARADALERALQSGADAAIVKPFEPAFVLAEAHRLVGRARRAVDRSVRLMRDLSAQRARGEELLQQSASLQYRTTNDAHERLTVPDPPIPAPTLYCPMCDRPLGYLSSKVGGVSTAPEQWDYYLCPGICGRFQYRHRTRKLRRL